MSDREVTRWQLNCFYYPNLVILPVDNNEHQRIDDVSTDRISYSIQSLETMGFRIVTHELFCPSVTMTVSLDGDMPLLNAWPSNVLAFLK